MTVLAIKRVIRDDPTLEARELGTTYLAGKYAARQCNYTISTTVTATLVGGQSATVAAQIRQDDQDAWETVAEVSQDLSFAISLVTLSLTSTIKHSLSFLVPKGYQYRVVASGDGSADIVKAQEL